MVLVDTNVLIDVAERDPVWGDWSAEQLELVSDSACINVLVYCEFIRGFRSLAVADRFLPAFLHRLPLPYDAAPIVNRAYTAYRLDGGARTSPLVDFVIGAHAEASGLTLLTRDAARFRTYFPGVSLLTP